MYHRWSLNEEAFLDFVKKSRVKIETRTGNFESSKIAQVFSVHSPASEDINDIIDHGSSVALSWRGDKANALKL